MLLFLVFRFGPAVAGVGLSFFEYSVDAGATFLGFDNFTRLFADDLFWHALRITVIYTVIAVPLSLVTSTGMALLTRRAFRGVRFFRSVFFLPFVTSLVLAGVVFSWILSSDGPWAALMSVVGLPENWLANDFLVLPAIALLSVWKGFGYGMLIILARLQDLPAELEEAAVTDGAGGWQRFRHIVLPQLRPALFFVAILDTVGSFQVFDSIYVMTGGGPARASYTLVFLLYDSGFKFFELGYAATIGVMLFVMTLVIAIIQRLLFGRD
jgi:multiple sugar transport system permease protein